MSKNNLVHQQVRRVSRRLLLQKLGTRLIFCWSAALGLAILWFLIQPFLIDSPQPWLRWAVAGGLAGLATVLAIFLTWLAAPSPLTAALSLDEKFGLKERVTTSLALSAREQASPAGQALLEDVHQRLEKIDVGSRFPMRLRWSAGLVPALALLLASVALFYDASKLIGKSDPGRGKPDLAAVIKPGNAIPPVVPPARPRTPAEQNEKPADLAKIDAEMERIKGMPQETPEQVTEKVKEISTLEDQIKEMEKARADRAKAVDDLSKLDAVASKRKQGPADDMKEALASQDIEKAKQEAEKLARKLKKKDLSDPEKEQLKKQMKDLEDQVKRLSRQQDKIDHLKSKNLDPETLKRELEQLAKEKGNRKDLDELAQKLSRCQKCMSEGNEEKAAEEMEQMARQLQRMGKNEEELEELQARAEELEDIKEDTTLQREAGGEGSGDKELQRKTGKGSLQGKAGRKDGLQRKGGPGPGGPASGRRPINPDGKSGSVDARQRTPLDLKGQKNFAGYAPGQKAPPRSGPQLEGVIRQQSQQAAEATSQQKLDKSDRDISKNYFGNLAEEVDKAKKGKR